MSISFDNTSFSFNQSVNSFNWNHTINVVNNAIVVIGISWRNSGAGTETVSSVTYGGNSCTLIRKDEFFASASKSTAIYYLVNPPVGVNNVIVNFSGTIFRAIGGVISLNGVDQTFPVDSHAGQAGGTGTSVSTNITTTIANTWLIDVLNVRNSTVASTVGVGQTERWNYQYDTSNSVNGTGSTKSHPTIGTTSMNWTTDVGIDGWSHSVVALAPYVTSATSPNYYIVEQLTEQSDTSSTFVDVPGTTLTFTPSSVSEIWAVWVSGVCRSSSTSEQSHEIRLDINGVERDLWSHQVTNASVANGGGYIIFDRITGTTALQTIKVQYRALTGTVRTSQVRVLAHLIPPDADFQYINSDNIVQETATEKSVLDLTFSPSSAGEYFVVYTIKHREFPGGSTSQATCLAADLTTRHPDTANVWHSCARDSWNPTTYIWRDTLTTGSKTYSIRFISSSSGSQASEHCYRKIMAFRADAFDATYYNADATQTSTTSTTYVQKNFLTTGATSVAQDHISIQTERVAGNSTSNTGIRAGELRIDGTPMIRTDHTISRNGSNVEGYHHTCGLAFAQNTANSMTYENGFLAPNGISVECAESSIVVLRYPAPSIGNTHQIIM